MTTPLGTLDVQARDARRVTVRNQNEDERLIDAAWEIAPTLPPLPAPETAA